mgnify:CR=1 FL=1
MEESIKYTKSKTYSNNLFSFDMLGEGARNMEDAEKQKLLTGMIANHMKKCFLIFNKDSVDDKTISLHLDKLSNGKLSLPEGFQYIDSASITRNKKSNHKRKFKRRK